MMSDTAPKKKSVALTPQERKALKAYRKRFETEVACAVSLGLDRNVLNRIMLLGTGSPDYIEQIRNVLNSLEG